MPFLLPENMGQDVRHSVAGDEEPLRERATSRNGTSIKGAAAKVRLALYLLLRVYLL